MENMKKSSGLRGFRFQSSQKGATAQSPSNSNSPLVEIPGRKRIKVMNDDSDSDNEASQNGTQTNDTTITAAAEKQEMSVAEKESCLVTLKSMNPEYDTMILQDILVRNSWDVDIAHDALASSNAPKRRKVNENGHTQQSSSRQRREQYDSDSDGGNMDEGVFDSDEDSDGEVSTKLSKKREAVFEFINTATEGDLVLVKTCSEKKAKVIISLRPFKNWHDLVKKMKSEKFLNGDILNQCQAFLMSRENLIAIMKKCGKIKARLEAAVEAGAEVKAQSELLNPDMKLTEYQMVGLNWLVVMHKEETNGILADEMGLGKTIQVIAFLAYLKEHNLARRPHLVIVPSSTLDNWANEFEKWCPALVVAKYYGSSEERRSLRIQWAKSHFSGMDVILSTYRVVMSSPEEKKMFRVTPFHCIVYDEAHMLKNMGTQRYEFLVKINGIRRILLTGTPLQNNLLELISLLCFVMPSIFAKKSNDIKNLFQKTKTSVKELENGAEDTNQFEQTQIEQAKSVMKPFVLRRLKRDVLKCLPPKTEQVIKVPLSPNQSEMYKNMIYAFSSADGIVRATAENNGMSMMMDMRKLANHPLLMRYHFTDDDVHRMAKILARDPLYKKQTNPQYVFEDLAYLSDFQLSQMTQKYMSISRGFEIPVEKVLDAGKIKQLDKLLPELKAGGHRVLIFSQFTMMLDILERYLAIRGLRYMRLDGQTSVEIRQELIDEYNDDCDIFVFLLSTRAGGLGINLTAADTVIIYDIDFNPYNDKQAEDRCHRMGQKKPVKIYKLISEGTIDEGMFVVAKEKLNLEREVTNDGVSQDDAQEHKCMVRLLTMALGTNEEKAESLLSPPSNNKQRLNSSTSLKDF